MLRAERRAREAGRLALQHKPLASAGASYGNAANDESPATSAENDAELKALEPEPDTPRRWWNAAAPVVVVTLVVVVSLVVTGQDACNSLGIPANGRNIFANADSYVALLCGSLMGTFTIWFLCWAQRLDTQSGQLVWFGRKRHQKPIMTVTQSLDYWVMGIRNLIIAIIILMLAWAVGLAFTTAGAGMFISSVLEGNIDPGSLPALTFIVSAIMSFVTGTSWGTMGIMFPLLLPAAHQAAPCNKDVFYGTTAAILAGSVFGDHCSPISDTTILSSIASRCELTAHVKTQIPYALLAGIVGVLFGNLPTGVSGCMWAQYRENALVQSSDLLFFFFFYCLPRFAVRRLSAVGGLVFRRRSGLC